MACHKSLRVRSVAPADEGDAYNLVVTDFSTYFVGENGLLAHDITVQRPTQAAVPGYVKRKANTADVASQR